MESEEMNCQDCGGTGQVWGDHPNAFQCAYCQGAGKVSRAKETRSALIQAGMCAAIVSFLMGAGLLLVSLMVAPLLVFAVPLWVWITIRCWRSFSKQELERIENPSS